MNKKDGNVLDFVIKIIKWVYIIAFILFSIFILFATFNSFFDDLNENPEIKGFPIIFAIVIIIIGSIGYLVFFFIGLIELILSLINKESLNYKKNFTLSLISMGVPIVTELLFIIIGLILTNIL